MQIQEIDREFSQAVKKEENCRRLLTIPGIGPLTATALTAAIGNATAFHKSRDLAAWLGLVPRQHSTGGKASVAIPIFDGFSSTGAEPWSHARNAKITHSEIGLINSKQDPHGMQSSLPWPTSSHESPGRY